MYVVKNAIKNTKLTSTKIDLITTFYVRNYCFISNFYLTKNMGFKIIFIIKKHIILYVCHINMRENADAREIGRFSCCIREKSSTF